MAKTQAEDMRVKRSETQVTAAFDPTQAFSGIEPIFQASNKLFENLMAVGSEILEFSRSRLDRSLEASKAIVRSGSIDEAMELQADYARTAVRDYFAEAGKIVDMSTRVMFDSLMAWQPAAREATRRTTQQAQAAE